MTTTSSQNLAARLFGGLLIGTQPSEPRKATATLEQARRHQQAGEWDEAAATYAELVEQDPDNPTFAFGLAISLHAAESMNPEPPTAEEFRG